MAVTDLSKLLKAEEIRKVLRAPNKKVHRSVLKMNPLKNVKAMLQLNPYEAVSKRTATLVSTSRAAKKVAAVDKKSGKKATIKNGYFFDLFYVLNFHKSAS